MFRGARQFRGRTSQPNEESRFPTISTLQERICNEYSRQVNQKRALSLLQLTNCHNSVNGTSKSIKSSTKRGSHGDDSVQAIREQTRDISSILGLENLYTDLSTPAGEVAIAHYFSYFVPPPKPSSSRDHFLECLQPMFTSTRPSTSLYHITCALALVTLSDRQRRPELRVEALGRYGQALGTLRVEISDPKKSASDEVLMTSMLSAVFEVRDHVVLNAHGYPSA